MTFGPDEASGARVTSLDDYNKCLDLLQQEGYNEIDTVCAQYPSVFGVVMWLALY